MVTVPIYQASSFAPPLSTLVIDLSSSKPISSPAQEPIIIATTVMTSTTLLLPPPPLTQSFTYSELASHVNEVVIEAVQNALQAPLLDRFRDLSEVQMKEILRDQMFESGSYISHMDHSSLYQALEASIEWDNTVEFTNTLVKSRKRCHDDQDPPPPPPKDSDRSKKTRHDSDASASQQP
ncbi:hypothetical protein Tco_1406627 [Tanacetum coccineum]